MEYTEKELQQERWKPIFGYGGMYEVSDLGRVRSKQSGEWKVMRPGDNGKGYLSVILSKNNNQKRFLVHRLVAQAFIENDDETKTLINHINEIKSDNKVSNLEWCTVSYNLSYNGIRYRRHHPQPKRSKIKDLYDTELSIDDNIKLFKSNGIECSRTTLWKLRRDLKLIQPHPKYKRDKVKSLYRPDLSIAENIELFRANGIECGKQTVFNLRKDLNLKGRSNWKRNEIKDLYNPNLSIKENLKVFKENGVECSYNTVMRLKKDLGLTKKYNRNQ